MEKDFKVLTQNGTYVDGNLLNKGIYETHKPTLYNLDTTIETLVKQAESFKMVGFSSIMASYIENIKQCTLVEVEVKKKLKIDFEKIKKQLAEALDKETKESLTEFIEDQRKEIPVTYFNIKEVSERYGQTLHCKWLSPDGNDWLDKFMLVNGTFIKEMENNCIKDVYCDEFYIPEF